jgi:hypothetical protein
MTLKERIDRRKNEPDPHSMCRRYELPTASPADGPLDKTFLSLWEKAFPGWELFYHPIAHRWIIYEVRIYGGVPADDTLVMREEVLDPMRKLDGVYCRPGIWLIEWCRNPDHGFDAMFKRVLDNQAQRKRDLRELVENFVDDLLFVAERKPLSVGFINGKPISSTASARALEKTGHHVSPLSMYRPDWLEKRQRKQKYRFIDLNVKTGGRQEKLICQ